MEKKIVKEMKEKQPVILLNCESVRLNLIKVSKVRPCKGIRYDPKDDSFLEISGFGFYVTECRRRLYSIVYDSDKMAEFKREEFMSKIASAGDGACLFF